MKNQRFVGCAQRLSKVIHVLLYVYISRNVFRDLQLLRTALGATYKMYENLSLINEGSLDNMTNSFFKNEWSTNILYSFSSVYLAMITIIGICLNSKALLSLIEITKVSKIILNCNIPPKLYRITVLIYCAFNDWSDPIIYILDTQDRAKLYADELNL